MEKTIHINGRPIHLKTHAAIPIQYRNQFGTDFFKDMFKIAVGFNDKKNWDDLTSEEIDSIDFMIFYQLFWLFARAANKSIPPIEEWLEEFDELPFVQVMPVIADMTRGLLQQKKRKKLPKKK